MSELREVRTVVHEDATGTSAVAIVLIVAMVLGAIALMMWQPWVAAPPAKETTIITQPQNQPDTNVINPPANNTTIITPPPPVKDEGTTGEGSATTGY